jgi:hypothetical protein
LREEVLASEVEKWAEAQFQGALPGLNGDIYIKILSMPVEFGIVCVIDSAVSFTSLHWNGTS